MTTTIFTGFLRVLGAWLGVQGGNILFLCRYIISMECKTCVLSTKLHKHDVFHKDWVWLEAQKDVNISL